MSMSFNLYWRTQVILLENLHTLLWSQYPAGRVLPQNFPRLPQECQIKI